MTLTSDKKVAAWLITGRERTKPVSAPIGADARVKGSSGPRRKVNSALRLGSLDAPSPVFFGSPVWSMNQSITRKNTSPS